MKPREYLESARVPQHLQPQAFGDWVIRREYLAWHHQTEFDWDSHTLLMRANPVLEPATWDTIHLANEDGMVQYPDVVMEDSPRELSRHLPIWLAAHGRVLITGLGLGCVLRGLLTSPRVEHIDVVEIDVVRHHPRRVARVQLESSRHDPPLRRPSRSDPNTAPGTSLGMTCGRHRTPALPQSTPD